MNNTRFEKLMNDPVMRATNSVNTVGSFISGFVFGVAMLQFGGLGGVCVFGFMAGASFLFALEKEARLLSEKQVDKR